LNVRIANHTILGSSTKLECTYDLEGENLYSVKWYKDGDEFFRYLPKSTPEIQVFEQQGIYIDVSIVRVILKLTVFLNMKYVAKRKIESLLFVLFEFKRLFVGVCLLLFYIRQFII